MRKLGGAAAILMIALPIALSGCAGNKFIGGKPKITLRVRSTKRLNAQGSPSKRRAYNLNYTCIQLSDASSLAGMTVEQLYGNWASLPGGVFLSAGHEVTISPESTITEEPMEIDARTRAIVVVGNFGEAGGPCFYYVQPVPEKNRKKIELGLTADSSCFVASSF